VARHNLPGVSNKQKLASAFARSPSIRPALYP
jgi:hypothetical protein